MIAKSVLDALETEFGTRLPTYTVKRVANSQVSKEEIPCVELAAVGPDDVSQISEATTQGTLRLDVRVYAAATKEGETMETALQTASVAVRQAIQHADTRDSLNAVGVIPDSIMFTNVSNTEDANEYRIAAFSVGMNVVCDHDTR